MSDAVDPALWHLLARMGLAAEPIAATRLTGGVSSDIWRVDLPGRSLVVKQPLARLRVEADWSAPVDRGTSEVEWLSFVARVLPGVTPQVLGFDAQAHAIALEYLDPVQHLNWKSELMAGRVDARFAALVGTSLGRIHAASARQPAMAARFANQDLFQALRIEPYLERTAQRVPQVRQQLGQVIAALRGTRVALVHGDVSPKNILTGTQPVFLDAECATWSDPAFDLAFCRTHLLLKELHLPTSAAHLRSAARAFRTAYLAQVDWEPAHRLQARADRLVGALLLARVAGASPADYLTDQVRRQVHDLGVAALTTGQTAEHLVHPATTGYHEGNDHE